MGRIGFKNVVSQAFRGFKHVQGVAKRGHKFLQGAPKYLSTLDKYAEKGADVLSKAGRLASEASHLTGSSRLSAAGSKMSQGAESIHNIRARGHTAANMVKNIMGESMAHH